MKNYQEYLDIIKKRDWEEKREEREQAEKWRKEHPESILWPSINTTISKFTFDYSVEIMGMMMQDFLEEFKKLLVETKKGKR